MTVGSGYTVIPNVLGMVTQPDAAPLENDLAPAVKPTLVALGREDNAHSRNP
jgi:hypothetical protein